MSNYSPLGLPIAPGQGTPKFPQQSPQQGTPGFAQAIGNAKADETSAQTGAAPSGPLLKAGTQPVVPETSATISDAYNKLPDWKRREMEAIYNATYSAGGE